MPQVGQAPRIPVKRGDPVTKVREYKRAKPTERAHTDHRAGFVHCSSRPRPRKPIEALEHDGQRLAESPTGQVDPGREPVHEAVGNHNVSRASALRAQHSQLAAVCATDPVLSQALRARIATLNALDYNRVALPKAVDRRSHSHHAATASRIEYSGVR